VRYVTRPHDIRLSARAAVSAAVPSKGRHAARTSPSARIILVAVLAATLAGAVPQAAFGGERRTAVTYNCHRVEVRPRWIVFACTDGGFFVRHLVWSRWHPFRAVAMGEFYKNDCDPSCAGGEFHTREGILRLRGRMWCDAVNRYVFERAVVRFERPLLGREGLRFRLFCP
jgi:hypothetical protein